MSSYDCCPNAGHKPHGLIVAYMNIYQCEVCKTKFCHACRSSNEGRRCPDCGSERKPKIWEAYVV